MHRDRLIDEVFQGYAHPVAALAPPYSGGAPDGLEPYPHDPGEAKRLLSEAGWSEGRALRLAATSDVTAVAEHLAGDLRDSLGGEVETIIIPDEDLISAQKTLVEKNCPYRSTFWSTPGSTSRPDIRRWSSTASTFIPWARSAPGLLCPSSRS
jgi:ABC-type transport system substrate-binding protein